MFVPVRLGANYVLSDRSSIVVSSQKKKERRTKEDVKSSLTRLRLRNKPSATNLPSPASRQPKVAIVNKILIGIFKYSLIGYHISCISE